MLSFTRSFLKGLEFSIILTRLGTDSAFIFSIARLRCTFKCFLRFRVISNLLVEHPAFGIAILLLLHTALLLFTPKP